MAQFSVGSEGNAFPHDLLKPQDSIFFGCFLGVLAYSLKLKTGHIQIHQSLMSSSSHPKLYVLNISDGEDTPSSLFPTSTLIPREL